MSDSTEDRTEAASQKHLQDAREEGDVPVSRELPILMALGAGLAAVAAQVPGDPVSLAAWLSSALSHAGEDGESGLRLAAHAVPWVVVPVGACAIAAGAGAFLLQTGFLFRVEALQPDITRLSPLKGFKRVFGIETLGTAGKALAKLAVLAGAFWFAILGVLPLLAQAPFWQPGQLYRQLARCSVVLILLLLGAQAAIAGADLLVVRLRYARRQRQSRHELKEEQKSTEGNPQIKQKLRQIARARAKRRMMAAVPKATVVVTNPTHYAVALAYERGGRGAPRVTAKGADEIAARIRELAQEHRIPIVANPPLARALYRIDIDTEIPSEMFRAVAEVIAYVWRLRNRAGRL
jgi:flagellar biosynthetic protein FlhB